MRAEKDNKKENEKLINIKTPDFGMMRILNTKELLMQKLKEIKYKIGVYSAKGGVGKTTIAVNLAYSLAQNGLKIGLLDADIDCPNVTIFLGINSKLDGSFPLKPILYKDVKVLSTAMLTDELSKPIIWRGPLIAKMITDFLENTDWGELDYLIIDLPPGTSDAPLTIMQLLDLSGFIIVTTPQRISALNSIRSGLMARRLNMSIIGVIENFSVDKINSNSIEVAEKLHTDIIGSIPYKKEFAELSDHSEIPVLVNQDIKEIFDNISNNIIKKLK
jgi:ATP-binding protein involved in chromosome partitioning